MNKKNSCLLMIFLLFALSICSTFGQIIDPASLPSYVHPPIFSPVQDGVKQNIPKELGNQKYASYGVVDVTEAPFFADPTGIKDSTKALQDVIDFARDNQMVCFFPSGTYLISDTLVCRHGLYLRSYKTAIFPFENLPCFLLGSRIGSRPKIKLAPNSKGFNNPDKKKFAVDYIIYKVENNHIIDTSPSSYVKAYNAIQNAAFINIDIEISNGNASAVAIRFNTAEGSVLQDVSIDVTNGYAGIDGASGNGGNWANITVIGGEIGLDMREYSVPTPTMVGITLIGQKQAAIMSKVRGSLTIIGLKIISYNNGPVIIAQMRHGSDLDGTMNIIDSEIIFEGQSLQGGKNTAISLPERNIYIKNLYVKNTDELVKGYSEGMKRGWVRIKEFAVGIDIKNNSDIIYSPIYVNGNKQKNILFEYEKDSSPPVDLMSKHLWDKTFPHFEMNNVINVKEPPYNAKGDSFNDDTIALQKAIDENEFVFLPKGYYRITKTIKLRPNTKLFGIAQHLSVIFIRDPQGFFGDINNPHPLIETANDSKAKTILAYCRIAVPVEAKLDFVGDINPVYAIKWMAGKNSIFRSVGLDPLRVYGFSFRKDRKELTFSYPHVVITENGGGKWYNFNSDFFYKKQKNTFRILYIDKISSPLFFYNFEPQSAYSTKMVEVYKSANISFFGCKTECNTTFIHFTESENFCVIGEGGKGNADRGGFLFKFDNCKNFIITNLTDQINFNGDIEYHKKWHLNYKKYFPISETNSGVTITLPSNERPVLYKRTL